MTYPEFLKALRKTLRNWTVDENHCIRMTLGAPGWEECCPITSLRLVDCFDWEDVAGELGLDYKLAAQIVFAADDQEGENIRRDLLKACGLT